MKVGANTAEVEWDDELLSSQYTTPIVHDGLVYGIDGRQDGGPVSLKCFDPLTRKVLWTKSDIPYATLVAADGKLLVQHTDGTLRLGRARPFWLQRTGVGVTPARHDPRAAGAGKRALVHSQ